MINWEGILIVIFHTHSGLNYNYFMLIIIIMVVWLNSLLIMTYVIYCGRSITLYTIVEWVDNLMWRIYIFNFQFNHLYQGRAGLVRMSDRQPRGLVVIFADTAHELLRNYSTHQLATSQRSSLPPPPFLWCYTAIYFVKATFCHTNCI